MEKTEAARTEKKTVPLEKELLLQEIEREFRASESTFFGRFERLNVQEMSELRRSLEKVSKRSLVVKHSLLREIFDKMKISEAAQWLEGSVFITFGGREPQLISKTLVEFVKGHGHFQLRGLVYDGKIYG